MNTPIMKYLQAIAVLATVTHAAKYPAGAICQTNKDCDANCLDSQWSVGQMNSDSVFICDPAKADTTLYFSAHCSTKSVQVGTFGGQQEELNTEATETVCKAQGGRMCEFGCVVSSKASAEGDLRSAWESGCTAKPSTRSLVIGRPTIQAAQSLSFCSG